MESACLLWGTTTVAMKLFFERCLLRDCWCRCPAKMVLYLSRASTKLHYWLFGGHSIHTHIFLRKPGPWLECDGCVLDVVRNLVCYRTAWCRLTQFHSILYSSSLVERFPTRLFNLCMQVHFLCQIMHIIYPKNEKWRWQACLRWCYRLRGGTTTNTHYTFEYIRCGGLPMLLALISFWDILKALCDKVYASSFNVGHT